MTSIMHSKKFFRVLSLSGVGSSLFRGRLVNGYCVAYVNPYVMAKVIGRSKQPPGTGFRGRKPGVIGAVGSLDDYGIGPVGGDVVAQVHGHRLAHRYRRVVRPPQRARGRRIGPADGALRPIVRQTVIDPQIRSSAIVHAGQLELGCGHCAR